MPRGCSMPGAAAPGIVPAVICDADPEGHSAKSSTSQQSRLVR